MLDSWADLYWYHHGYWLMTGVLGNIDIRSLARVAAWYCPVENKGEIIAGVNMGLTYPRYKYNYLHNPLYDPDRPARSAYDP